MIIYMRLSKDYIIYSVPSRKLRIEINKLYTICQFLCRYMVHQISLLRLFLSVSYLLLLLLIIKIPFYFHIRMYIAH
jgi:hypothetical protein